MPSGEPSGVAPVPADASPCSRGVEGEPSGVPSGVPRVPADASSCSGVVEEGEPTGVPSGLPPVPANARATAAGLVWELPAGASLDNCIALWLGTLLHTKTGERLVEGGGEVSGGDAQGELKRKESLK